MDERISAFLESITDEALDTIDIMAAGGKHARDIADVLNIQAEEYEGLSLFVSERYEYWMLNQRRSNLRYKVKEIAPTLSEVLIDVIADSLDSGIDHDCIKQDFNEAIHLFGQIVEIHGKLAPTVH